MAIRLGDPGEPRRWARIWPEWDAEAFAEFDVDLAYHQGWWAGREAFAAELVPLLRWILASVPCDIALLDPDELRDIDRLLRGDIRELMARAIRARDQAEARRQADAEAAWSAELDYAPAR